MKTHRADPMTFAVYGRPTSRFDGPGARLPSRPSRWRALAVGGVAAALLLAACSSSTSSAKPSAKGSAASSPGAVAAGSVVIGYETGGDSALATAIHNNYFQEELGSQVSLKVFSSGPAALSAIASGALNFMCVLGLPPVISAIAKGVPLKIIDAEDRYTTDAGLVARRSTGITSVADLRGKTVGIVVGSQSTFELAQYLKTAGMTLGDVNQVNMSPPEIQSAWATGQIDAGIVWAPVYDYMASHNGTVLMTDKNLPPTATSYNVCVTNASYAAAHPANVTAFLLALNRGSVFAAAHPTTAAGYNAAINGITLAGAQQIDQGYVSPGLSQQVTGAVLGGSQSNVATAGVTESLGANWNVLYKAGFITTAPPSDLAQYIGWSFVYNAVKKVSG